MKRDFRETIDYERTTINQEHGHMTCLILDHNSSYGMLFTDEVLTFIGTIYHNKPTYGLRIHCLNKCFINPLLLQSAIMSLQLSFAKEYVFSYQKIMILDQKVDWPSALSIFFWDVLSYVEDNSNFEYSIGTLEYFIKRDKNFRKIVDSIASIREESPSGICTMDHEYTTTTYPNGMVQYKKIDKRTGLPLVTVSHLKNHNRVIDPRERTAFFLDVSNLSLYQGYLCNQKKCGYGVQLNNAGSVICASMNNNKIVGNALLISKSMSNSTVYCGNIEKQHFSGYGTMYYQNYSYYEGKWEKSQYKNGILILNNPLTGKKIEHKIG